MGEGVACTISTGCLVAEKVHLPKEIGTAERIGELRLFPENQDILPAGENNAGASVRKFLKDFSNLFRPGEKGLFLLSNVPRVFKAQKALECVFCGC
jgi:hypothetical protein